MNQLLVIGKFEKSLDDGLYVRIFLCGQILLLYQGVTENLQEIFEIVSIGSEKISVLFR